MPGFLSLRGEHSGQTLTSGSGKKDKLWSVEGVVMEDMSLRGALKSEKVLGGGKEPGDHTRGQDWGASQRAPA